MSAYRYAARTTVDPVQSRIELERILERVGADSVATMRDSTAAAVAFRLDGRNYVLRVPYPEQGARNRDQQIRSKWRALVLLLKAKLVAIEAGVTTPETEFLAHAMLPTGATLIEHLRDNPEQLTTTGRLMLPRGD